MIALAEPGQISKRIRNAVERGPNYVSAISYWEVLLKSMKGRLDIGEPQVWWTTALEHLAATPLSLRADHVSAISALPPIHQDPFDRALIAQATTEGLTMITTDGDIARYASERFQVL